MNTTEAYLQPLNSSQKSFYKKALYEIWDMESSISYYLYSYDTQVLWIHVDKCNPQNNYYVTNDYTAYSRTTIKHVKEMLIQFLPNYTEIFGRGHVSIHDILKHGLYVTEFAKKTVA